jgi:dephospho-CoA kinase
MVNRILAVGGKPATGKTTLIRKIIRDLGQCIKFKFGLVRGLYFEEYNLYIIGIYDKSTFSGTDKLSMAVQPDFLRFLKKVKKARILFEGDRLFNQSLFDKVKCEILILEVSHETELERHKTRNDNQSEKFIKSKETKIENIKKNNSTTIARNDTKSDFKDVYDKIIYFCTK